MITQLTFIHALSPDWASVFTWVIIEGYVAVSMRG